MTITPTLRRLLQVTALSLAVTLGLPAAAQNADAQKGADKAQPAVEEHNEIERQDWTFAGLTGHFDQQQLRRGYKVYKTICANCHSMKLMYFRNLGQPGGPEFPKEVVDQLASEYQVPDEDKNDGSTRPAKA